MLFRSNDTATTEIYTTEHTLSLHDALPISVDARADRELTDRFLDFVAISSPWINVVPRLFAQKTFSRPIHRGLLSHPRRPSWQPNYNTYKREHNPVAPRARVRVHARVLEDWGDALPEERRGRRLERGAGPRDGGACADEEREREKTLGSHDSRW